MVTPPDFEINHNNGKENTQSHALLSLKFAANIITQAIDDDILAFMAKLFDMDKNESAGPINTEFLHIQYANMDEVLTTHDESVH